MMEDTAVLLSPSAAAERAGAAGGLSDTNPPCVLAPPDCDKVDCDDELIDNEVSLFEVEDTALVHVVLPCAYSDSGTRLALAQYTTAHDDWGMFSTVWDGGLGLLAYLSLVYNTKQEDWSGVTLLDLGAGTGLVGLGVAALAQGRAVVAVTDLAFAVPLLESNVAQNRHLWTKDTDTTSSANVPAPHVHILEWGQPIDKEWLQQVLQPPHQDNSRDDSARRVLVTGADVVYRKPLMAPLLATLSELAARVREYSAPSTTLDCLLACQSIRTHLDDFWALARKLGFAVERLAVVDLDAADKLHVGGARVTVLTTAASRQLPPVTETVRKEGRLWIVRIRKLPYTFAI
jgi:predicted nicotinamide N-methyase